MILFDDRWLGPHGIGCFAGHLMQKLPQLRPLGGNLPPLHPFNPVYLSWQIHRQKPAVFFSPGFNPPLFCRCPFIFTIHDLNHIQFKQANIDISKRLYYHYFLKPACHRAFKVLTVSEFSRKNIMVWSGLSEDKVVNVSNGVSEEFSPSGGKYSPGFRYIFWVGSSRPHKNLKRILESFRNSNARKKLKLLLAGNINDDIRKIVQQWRLSDDVVFAGVISEQEIPLYYRGAEFFIFPSLYEGFGLPVIEAMACGIPVITSDCTSLPEVAADACMLVNPHQTAEITYAIDILAENTELRRCLREKGLRRAAEFSWQKTASKVWNVLQEAIQ